MLKGSYSVCCLPPCACTTTATCCMRPILVGSSKGWHYCACISRRDRAKHEPRQPYCCTDCRLGRECDPPGHWPAGIVGRCLRSSRTERGNNDARRDTLIRLL